MPRPIIPNDSRRSTGGVVIEAVRLRSNQLDTPSGQILVECRRIEEHPSHVADTGGIPAADVTIIDLDAEYVIDTEKFKSKSRNCPYHGWNVKAKVQKTIVAGEIRFSADE